MLSWSGAQAQTGDDAVPSVECCLTLLYPVGARTVAMGQALTARGGQEAMFLNPASLMDLDDDEIIVHRTTLGQDDESQKMTTLSVVIHSKVAGVFGVTYRFIDYGKDQATDEAGNVTGQLATIDQTLIASFATAIGKSWSAGVNYRLYNFAVNCDGACERDERSGTTHMIDLGLRYAPPFVSQLLVGAAVLYAGQKLQVNNAFQADVTPARFRIGAAYDASKLITSDSTTAVWLHVDAIGRIHESGAPAINAGVEVVLDNTIFFRAGHASDGGGVNYGGNAVGLGLKYQRFTIDVAKSVTPSPIFEEPFYVSFGLSF